MGLSSYLRNKIMDHVLKGTAFTFNPVYVSLHTADPGSTGASEVTGGSYVRVAVSAVGWNAAVGGLSDNINAIQWPGMPAATLTHVGLWDAPSGGNFGWGGPLTVPETVGAGATFQINGGNLDVALT